LSTGRDLTDQVKPPRSLFMNYPMGNNFGGPTDIDQQLRILRRSLQMIEEVEIGGIMIDWKESWPSAFEYFTGKTKSAQ